MGHRNDISYGRYVDSGYGMRYSDSDVDHPSDDSDVSAAPSRRSKGGAKSSRSRGPKLRTLNRWTPEEHERLAYLVSKWGCEKNWAKVAEEMPGRTGKQCRERWLNHMKPGIIKGNWSFEEEFLLAQCHAVVGSHWSKMTKRLPGRTENSIKNFWNATLRSKAPHKRRGILWLYMQQQTCQEGENVDAFLVSIARLYETQELPAYWAQLMEEGRLTERTLRAVLRAEKEFLENPDAELHPLAMPHPTHGLFGASDTGAAAAPAAGPSGAPTPCPESDVGYDTGRQAQQNPSAPPLSEASLVAAAAAAAAGGSYGPASPLPVPGLTPRFPGADYVSVQHNSAAPASAAFDASTMPGLALPPEVLAALGPPEVWTALPSAQARVGPFGGASMEPLMPALGLNSDLRASGADGAFGGNGGSSILAAGHDTIWSCLPSLRGLGSTGCVVPAAAEAYTPGPAGDPLRLLEPYGALQGHHSSSTSIQTARADSALEFEPQAGQQHAADRQGVRRDSSSRPGNGMGPLRAEGLEPGAAAAGGDSAAFKQVSSMQGGAGSRPATPEHPMHGLNSSYHSHHDAAAGQSSQAQHPWFGQGGRLDAGMQAAAEFVLNAWGGHYAQQQQEPQQQQQNRQQHDGRGSSPADSVTQSDLAYGSAPGASGSAAYQPSGHGPHCSCNVCCVRYQRGAGASQHNSPNSNSLASSQALGSYVPWEQAVKGSSSYQQQQQYNAAAAWHSPARSGQQQADAQQQQQQTLAHAASEGCLTAGNGSYQQHSLEPRMKSINSAPLPASRLQHQNSSGHSPFARHANAVWDTAASGSEAAGGGAAAAYAPSVIEPPAATAGVQGGWDTQQGRGNGQELQQQQKEGPSRQQLQLGSLAGSTAGGLFSPRTAESPMSGALQHLLDSAAAQAGVRTEDICAWLAAANGPQAPGQEADGEEEEQQEEAEAEQQARHDWLTGPEFSALDNGHRARMRNGLDHLTLSTNDEQGNNMSGAGNVAIGAQDASFACSILEALLTSRHSSQLGDMLMSPAGIAGSAALLQSLPPTPAALSAATALHAAVAGLKRERSFPEPHDDADLLIEQPGTKLPRVF